VEEGRRVWQERAHLGDLAAVRARSRITESEALTDPGAFAELMPEMSDLKGRFGVDVMAAKIEKAYFAALRAR